MKSEFIVDVNESDFEFEVLAYSVNKPVVVDFWATWCAPCRVLGPLLEKLAIEFQGSFRLAKVDVDKNPMIATHYKIRSVPTVMVFKNGEPMWTGVGLRMANELKTILNQHITP